MARGKVKLAWIENSATRRSTMQKRCRGLVKKVSEINTLCGVDAAIVVYSSNDGQPEVWPNAAEAQRLLCEFKSCTDLERNSKTMNQETFLRHKIKKLQEQLHKEETEVRDIEINTTIFEGLAGKDFNDLEIEKVGLVSWYLEKKIEEISNKLAELQGGINNPNNIIQSDLHFGNATQDVSVFEGQSPPRFIGGSMNMNSMTMVSNSFVDPMSLPMNLPSFQSVLHFGHSTQEISVFDAQTPPSFIGGSMNMNNMAMLSNSFGETLPMPVPVPRSLHSFDAGVAGTAVQEMLPVPQNQELLQGQNWIFNAVENDIVSPTVQEMMSERCQNVEFLQGQNQMPDNLEASVQQVTDSAAFWSNSYQFFLL